MQVAFSSSQIHTTVPELYLQQLAAGGLQLLQIRPGLRLDVAASQRLGAAGAERDPLAVRQQKFVAVGGDELFHLERADGFQTRTKFRQQRVLFLRRKAAVDAIGVKFADLS